MDKHDDEFFLQLEGEAFEIGYSAAALLMVQHFKLISLQNEDINYLPNATRIKTIADTVGLYEEDAALIDKAAYSYIAKKNTLKEPDLSISILNYIDSEYLSAKFEYKDWCRKTEEEKQEELRKEEEQEAASERKVISFIVIAVFILAIIVIGLYIK